MSSNYRFQKPPSRPTFGALPEGDYSFVVAACDEPYESKAGNQVLRLKLTIHPDGTPVFDNPWAGTDKNGDERDGIAEFLLCVNRAPKPGQEPDWGSIVGAKGKCHLKVVVAEQGTLAGKEVNKVAFYFVPKQVGPAAGQELQTVPAPKAKQASQGAGGPVGPDLTQEPDDIPFSPNRV